MRFDDNQERTTPLLASGDPRESDQAYSLGGADRGVGTGSGTPNRTGGGYGTGDPDSGRQQGNNPPERRDPDSSDPTESPRRDPDQGSQQRGGRGPTNR